MYNMDETGINRALDGITTGEKYVFAKELGGPQYKTNSFGARNNQTIVDCISADGFLTDLFVITKGKLTRPDEKFFNDNKIISKAGSGFITNDLALEWLEFFDKQTRPRMKCESDFRLLIMDGHGSHTTQPFVQKAIERNIIVQIIPPHSSHVMQPLDAVFFGVFKRTIEKLMMDPSCEMSSGLRGIFDLVLKARVEAKKSVESSWKRAGFGLNGWEEAAKRRDSTFDPSKFENYPASFGMAAEKQFQEEYLEYMSAVNVAIPAANDKIQSLSPNDMFSSPPPPATPPPLTLDPLDSSPIAGFQEYSKTPSKHGKEIRRSLGMASNYNKKEEKYNTQVVSKIQKSRGELRKLRLLNAGHANALKCVDDVLYFLDELDVIFAKKRILENEQQKLYGSTAELSNGMFLRTTPISYENDKLKEQAKNWAQREKSKRRQYDPAPLGEPQYTSQNAGSIENIVEQTPSRLSNNHHQLPPVEAVGHSQSLPPVMPYGTISQHESQHSTPYHDQNERHGTHC